MEAGADFWVYFNIIRKRFWLILLLFLVTEGVILSVTYTAKPVYRATVRLQVLPAGRSDVSLFSEYRPVSSVNEIQQAQNDFIRALKSGFVAWKTIADLNLDIGALDLLSGLSTAIEGDFIVVTVEAEDPGQAAAIATTQVNNALEYFRNVRATPSRVLRKFISEQLEGEQKKLLEAEQALVEFKKKHNLDSLEREMASLQDLVRSLKLQREQARMDKEKMAIFAQAYRDQQKKAEKKVAEIEEKGEEFAPNTLKFYRDLARQYEEKAIDYEARRDGYAKQVEIYDQVIAEREAELRKLLDLYIQYKTLEQNLAQIQNNYNFLKAKENEARLKQLQAERLGYIQITEPARKPDAPVPSKMPQLLAVGAAVSILTGFILSFLIEFLGSLRRAARKQRVS
ncbi:MAG: hypothetical protein J7M05_13250 [Anaerolineae bacterium]|nr:hypothetical protein [Anaerolineae bacterium]